jgi:hypothetical protein
MRALSIPAGFVPAVLLILCCVPALPQSEKGSILGTVRDASGAAVANIVVKVTNTASNVT